MVVQYNVCDIELPYPLIFPFPSLFPYPVNVQQFLNDLISGLPYPGLFPFPGLFHFPVLFPCTGLFNFYILFPYPIKSSIRKSEFLIESNNN